MLAGAGALFALVMVIFAMVYRQTGWGSRISPARWIVLGGLVLPAFVLLPLVAYALIAGERLLPLPGSAPPRIEAEGQQWYWTFRYPEHGGVETKNVMLLPAGVPVDIVVSSRDVIHAFWIPRLAGKIDAIPGHPNVLRIKADAPGPSTHSAMNSAVSGTPACVSPSSSIGRRISLLRTRRRPPPRKRKRNEHIRDPACRGPLPR